MWFNWRELCGFCGLNYVGANLLPFDKGTFFGHFAVAYTKEIDTAHMSGLPGGVDPMVVPTDKRPLATGDNLRKVEACLR